MSTTKTYEGFTAEERAAMKDRAKELKAAGRRGSRTDKTAKADGESEVLAKLAEMNEPDRVLGERLYAIIKATAPSLAQTLVRDARLRPGRQAICFFQGAQKFNSRYATLGFSDKANLDDGTMWPTSYALTELTADTEAKIAALVKQALSKR